MFQMPEVSFLQVDKVRMSAKCMKRLKLTSNEIAVKEISKKINGLYTHVVSNVSITSCFLKKKYAKYGGLIVGFQPLMVISPTASWIRWCMQVYAW